MPIPFRNLKIYFDSLIYCVSNIFHQDVVNNFLSGDYYLDGSNKEVDRLTLTRSIYDETYGQWDGTSFTAPTEGFYEFTIRMIGISSDTTGPPIILPKLNGFLIDKWHCKIYGNADCQKTFQGKVISMEQNSSIIELLWNKKKL